MGAGEAKRPRVVRAGAAVLRLLLSLLLFLLLLLLILRAATSSREHEVAAPTETTRFQTPLGGVAARLSGPANGPPIILVHGTAAWSGFWSEIASHLAQRGWRVVAIDLPPFGWSDRDPAGRYDRVSQADRLAGVAATLGKPSIVLGHSFGAGPVTEFALRYPHRTRGILLVDAALGELDPGSEATAAKALRFKPLAQLTTAAAITNPPALEPFLRSMIYRKDHAHRWIPVLLAPMQRDGTTSAYAAWLPNLFTKQDGAWSRQSVKLSAIRVPVALIWGAEDSVTPLPQGRRIAALTRARPLRVLPGVGHIPHIEDPRAFERALDQSLIDLTTGGR